MSRAAPAVTTVVMTRNRWSDLERSLPRHTPPVILVDNASEDGTPGRVRAAFPDIEVIELPENHGAVARNVGVAAARTPLVAFADDDSWWAAGALDRATDHFEQHPRLAVLAARILVGPDQVVDPVCAEMARSPLPRATDLPGPSLLGFVACGAVVRREPFLAAGGFDDVVEFAGEEERLALDLASRGGGLAYADDVVAHHHPSPTREGSAQRRIRVARNRILTAVMRRPWHVVLRVAMGELGDVRAGGPAVARAIRRLPRAVRAREVLPRRVEQQRRLLDV